MRSATTSVLSLSAAVVILASVGDAQERRPDPRVGLKGGLKDAAHVSRNLELIASLPKPEGFFDPKAPAGQPTPPEQNANPANSTAAAGDRPTEPRPNAVPSPEDIAAANRLSFSNSDMAFHGNHLFVGNYHGFNVYDVENRSRPRLLASIVCPGGQGDVSVYGHLLFMSVEQTRGRVDCGTQGVQATISTERFRGIRIFDITD